MMYAPWVIQACIVIHYMLIALIIPPYVRPTRAPRCATVSVLAGAHTDTEC